VIGLDIGINNIASLAMADPSRYLIFTKWLGSVRLVVARSLVQLPVGSLSSG